MKRESEHKPEVIQRDQQTIDSMKARIDTAITGLQHLIDEAEKIGAEVTAENWQAFLRNPAQTAIDQITAGIPVQMVGGFQKKRSVQIAELELPDMTGLVNAVTILSNDLKRLAVPQNMLNVSFGIAERNEAAFQTFVDQCTIYATDAEFWQKYKRLEAALNEFNQGLEKYGTPPINIITPLKQFFTLSNTGQLIANPEKYVSVVNC